MTFRWIMHPATPLKLPRNGQGKSSMCQPGLWISLITVWATIWRNAQTPPWIGVQLPLEDILVWMGGAGDLASIWMSGPWVFPAEHWCYVTCQYQNYERKLSIHNRLKLEFYLGLSCCHWNLESLPNLKCQAGFFKVDLNIAIALLITLHYILIKPTTFPCIICRQNIIAGLILENIFAKSVPIWRM